LNGDIEEVALPHEDDDHTHYEELDDFFQEEMNELGLGLGNPRSTEQ